ncbi:thermonuclease family protein [Hymenobacter artigasi]|uniref:Endonuclease YncB(Thermonuclease family) n=1 Tax=Hymenobacter artigasi TaxID=2719616 RepID=A0ABX1HI51_9BACT|nr:endonuclease YncB(thermonuclease family) [Hymenobacter artigasi]
MLLVAGSIGAAAVGALPFASRSCAGPAWELPANGLMRVAGLTAPKAESGRVVRVVDGDTYDVLAGGVRYRVRLLGVDAPELDQAFGPQASDSVTRRVQLQLVWLTRRGVDLYGRTLATVRLPVAGGPTLALDSLLVVRGWAWAWDPKRRVAGRAAQQAAAVAGRRGLWKCGAGDALPPKLWRQFNYKNKRRYGVGCTW